MCLLSKILHFASAWKSGNGFPLIRHRYHSCDLGKSVMLSAQLYTLCFPALWCSGSENYNIVRNRVHYTVPSESKYYIQMRFWVFTQGFWRAGSLEYRVVPSKLMKGGENTPLKHQEGGEGTPLKDSKLGALWSSSCPVLSSFQQDHFKLTNTLCDSFKPVV